MKTGFMSYALLPLEKKKKKKNSNDLSHLIPDLAAQ